jgi:hypothetical protein
MTNSASIAAHPRIVELRARRAACATRLAEILTEMQHIKNQVLPRLLDDYDTHFRTLEITLQKATLHAAELGRREELFRLKLERGEQLTERMIEVVNTIVDREFARVKKRIRETFDMTAQEREREATDRAERHNTGDFAKLYRAIVKKLHPDALGGEVYDSIGTNTDNDTHNVQPPQILTRQTLFILSSFGNLPKMPTLHTTFDNYNLSMILCVLPTTEQTDTKVFCPQKSI